MLPYELEQIVVAENYLLKAHDFLPVFAAALAQTGDFPRSLSLGGDPLAGERLWRELAGATNLFGRYLMIYMFPARLLQGD
jgi:hypothetical protein